MPTQWGTEAQRGHLCPPGALAGQPFLCGQHLRVIGMVAGASSLTTITLSYPRGVLVSPDSLPGSHDAFKHLLLYVADDKSCKWL